MLVSLRDIGKRYPDGLPTLDPIEDMAIADDPALAAAVAEAHSATAALTANPGAGRGQGGSS